MLIANSDLSQLIMIVITTWQEFLLHFCCDPLSALVPTLLCLFGHLAVMPVIIDIEYILRIMHSIVLCFGAGWFYPYVLRLLDQHWGSHNAIEVVNKEHGQINSSAPQGIEWNLRLVIFKLILVIDDSGNFLQIALSNSWMSLDLTDDTSTLVQVMVWCQGLRRSMVSLDHNELITSIS